MDGISALVLVGSMEVKELYERIGSNVQGTPKVLGQFLFIKLIKVFFS